MQSDQDPSGTISGQAGTGGEGPAGRRTAITARDLVRHLAEQARALALIGDDQDGRAHILADRLAALAGDADHATSELEACVVLAHLIAERPQTATSILSDAVDWVDVAIAVVKTALVLYSDICELALDRLAVVQEHNLTTAPARSTPLPKGKA